MDAVKKFVAEWRKTIVAFLSVWIGQVLIDLFQSGTPWPQTRDEWIRYAGLSLLAALGVGVTRNKITQAQLDKDKNVVGGVVVPDAAIVPPAATVPAPVTQIDGNYTNPYA